MLESLFQPRTIAVIGASRNPAKVGHKIVANLLQAGFEGDIIPVNPKADEVLGLKCYHNIAAYPGRIDQSILVIPARFVNTAVEESIAAGATAVNVISAGFKETGAEGAALEAALKDLCAAHGVRILGPNCLGLLNTSVHMNASFANVMPKAGNISFLTQSGALCTAMLDWANALDVGFAKVITIGNKADLDETEFLTVLRDDPATAVVVAYLESIDRGQAFLEAAAAASDSMPVIVFKSGVTDAGSKAASSHTGSLAGADVAYDAAFRRCGVIRARSFDQMLDYTLGFAGQPLAPGDGVGIVTNAGGPGIMAADAVELSGLRAPSLAPDAAAALAASLPPAASVANPIDVLGDAPPDRYATAVRAALAADNVDAVIAILTPQAVTDAEATAQAIIDCANHINPILTVFMGGTDVAGAARVLRQAGIPNYSSPDRAVAVLKAMRDLHLWRARGPRLVETLRVDQDSVTAIIERHRHAGILQVNEPDTKAILRAYGLRVPPGAFAADTDAAVAAAEAAGYPVAMKIVSPDALHKSDVGGVLLDLADAPAVGNGFEAMMKAVRGKLPAANLQGVYIEKMCPRGGREVILGMSRDPQFGPLLMFGLGGIFVEVLKDVTFRIAPITAAEAMEMLRDTESFPLLQGVRGQAGVDLDAIADSMQRVSQLVTDFPMIAEMDINPFIAGAAAADSLAADGRVTLVAD